MDAVQVERLPECDFCDQPAAYSFFVTCAHCDENKWLFSCQSHWHYQRATASSPTRLTIGKETA